VFVELKRNQNHKSRSSSLLKYLLPLLLCEGFGPWRILYCPGVGAHSAKSNYVSSSSFPSDECKHEEGKEWEQPLPGIDSGSKLKGS